VLLAQVLISDPQGQRPVVPQWLYLHQEGCLPLRPLRDAVIFSGYLHSNPSPMTDIGCPQHTSSPLPSCVTTTSLPQILHLYFWPTFVAIVSPFFTKIMAFPHYKAISIRLSKKVNWIARTGYYSQRGYSIFYFCNDFMYAIRSFSSCESAASGFPAIAFWIHAWMVLSRFAPAFSRPLPPGWQVLQLLSSVLPPNFVSAKSCFPLSAFPSAAALSLTVPVPPESLLPAQAAWAGSGYPNPTMVAPATRVVILNPARIFLKSFWFIKLLPRKVIFIIFP